MPISPADIESRIQAIVSARILAQDLRVVDIEKTVMVQLLPHLDRVVGDLERRLPKLTKDSPTIKRDQALAAWINQAIKKTYNPELREQRVKKELRTLAKDESKAMGNAISFDGRIKGVAAGLTNSQAKAMLVKPVQGSRLRAWIDDLGNKTAKRLHAESMQGWIQGESIDKISKRFQKVTNSSRAQANVLARTWTQDVSARARANTIDQNRDVISAVEWSAALDRRTCSLCGPLHGRVFLLEEGKGVSVKSIPLGVGGEPRPPRHCNCRCSLIPRGHSWAKKLGIRDEAGLKKLEGDYKDYSAKAGQLKKNKDYWTWLQKRPESVQVDHLGKTRLDMIKRGKISYDDILDKNGNQRTVGRLEKLTQRKQQPTYNIVTPSKSQLKQLDSRLRQDGWYEEGQPPPLAYKRARLAGSKEKLITVEDKHGKIVGMLAYAEEHTSFNAVEFQSIGNNRHVNITALHDYAKRAAKKGKPATLTTGNKVKRGLATEAGFSNVDDVRMAIEPDKAKRLADTPKTKRVNSVKPTQKLISKSAPKSSKDQGKGLVSSAPSNEDVLLAFKKAAAKESTARAAAREAAKKAPRTYRTFKNPEEALRWGNGKYRSWGRGLSNSELGGVQAYGGPAYKHMNILARTGNPPKMGPRPEYLKSNMRNLDKALEKSRVPEDITVYRGVHKDFLEKIDIKAMEGKTFTDKGYMSTSVARKYAEGYGKDGAVFEIRLKKGQRGAFLTEDITDNAELEVEMLLPRNTKLKILKVDGNHILAEVA